MDGIERKNSEGFDSLLTKLGFGRWTIFMFSIYLFWASFIPYFSLGGAFYNPSVNHWCQVEELVEANWTLEQQLNYSIPWEIRGGELVKSDCMMNDRGYQNVTKNTKWNETIHQMPPQDTKIVPCKKWHYDDSTFQNTVSMEWNLVCNDEGWSPFFQSFYFIGTTVGEPIIGIFADRYGRRTLLRGTSIIFTAVAATSAFVPYYSLVLTGRFILGMLHASIGVGYIHAMEACPPKYRTISGLLLTTPFAMTGILFGVVAYFFRDWRTLQLVCTIPTLFAVLFVPFMDESPRWQVLRGDTEQAKKSLKKAARWHNVSLSDHEIDAFIQEEQFNAQKQKDENNKYKISENTNKYSLNLLSTTEVIKKWLKSFFTLVRTPVLRRITLANFVCWFATGVTYWGMSLSGTTYSSNPFLYMILSSLAEIPGYAGFVPFVARFGRKKILSLNFAICSASILGILFVPKDCTWAVFTLALVGKLFITGSYNILYLFSSELFPTEVRAKGLNVSSMMARIGSIVSPFIIKILANTYWWAPSLTFGCAAAFGSLGALLLPESKGKPLSETVEQVEILYGNNNRSNIVLESAFKRDQQLMTETNNSV